MEVWNIRGRASDGNEVKLHGLLSPRTATLELMANTFLYCLHSLLPFPLCN